MAAAGLQTSSMVSILTRYLRASSSSPVMPATNPPNHANPERNQSKNDLSVRWLKSRRSCGVSITCHTLEPRIPASTITTMTVSGLISSLRRKLEINPETVIVVMVLAGILGSKVWHVIDTPQDRLDFSHLTLRSFFDWFRSGFAWFGGFVAGITGLLLLARKYRVNMLTMLDVCSPAAAIGYAVGRIGCLISGDGDYGKPTNLPWGMVFPNGLVPTTETCPQWGPPA